MTEPDGPVPDRSPKDRVRSAVGRLGEPAVVQTCIDVIRTGEAPPDEDLALVLGGAHARHELRRDQPPRTPQDHWWTVWALRVLLYAWGETAEPFVTRALGHDAWRVREMAVKVVAAREIGMAADAVAAAVTDPLPRVRAAALRALGVVGEHEHVDVVRNALDDPDPSVAIRAEQALDRLVARLDL